MPATTRAPSATSRRAVASPMPLPAPLTRTTLPVRPAAIVTPCRRFRRSSVRLPARAKVLIGALMLRRTLEAGPDAAAEEGAATYGAEPGRVRRDLQHLLDDMTA